jgi:SAM-dependent methyltransferase
MLRALLNRARRVPGLEGGFDLEAVALEDLHHYDEPDLPLQPGGVAVPNRRLRASAGTADLAMFLGIGEAWAHLVSRHLPAEASVLDLGCGCGKLARFLALNPRLSYLGVDLFKPSILWCRRAFATWAERFRFEHFDGHSPFFNPHGDVAVTDYRLPTADRSMDLVICGSLFTHLFEADARHYLAEIARVLKPGGGAILSLHVDVPPGQTYAGSEARVDVDEGYFLSMCRDAGLASHEPVGLVYGQRVHVVRT